MSTFRTAVLVCLVLLVLAFSNRSSDEVVHTEYFSFHSDAWVNLHHFLYQWARDDLDLASGRQRVEVSERSDGNLSARDAEAWEEAVGYYRRELAERTHWDRELLTLKIEFLDLGGDPEATPPGVTDEHARALAVAMPVYQRTWWEGHDRANRHWIETVIDRTREHEQAWVDVAIRVFGGDWDERLRVDASAYANWAGGYTSTRPNHAVLWSLDETNLRGLYGFELLMHESGHQASIGGASRDRIERIFAEEGVDVPANLQHALLFAAAGRFTQAVAEAEGLPSHTPYVVERGLTGFRGWSSIWPAVAEHWMPVVDGTSDPDSAVREIARSLR